MSASMESPHQATEQAATTADLIRFERDKRGWRQVDLAMRMAGSGAEVKSLVRSIQRWEAGDEPKRRSLRRMAAAFGVPVSTLLGGDDDEMVEVVAGDVAEMRSLIAELRQQIARLVIRQGAR